MLKDESDYYRWYLRDLDERRAMRRERLEKKQALRRSKERRGLPPKRDTGPKYEYTLRRAYRRTTRFVRWYLRGGNGALVSETYGQSVRLQVYERSAGGRVIPKDFPQNHVNDKRDYYRKKYLKTEHWKELKRAKLQRMPFCEVCGGKRNLDVHHIRYRNLYDVTLADLRTLCRPHHEAEHARLQKLEGRTEHHTRPKGRLTPKQLKSQRRSNLFRLYRPNGAHKRQSR